MRMSSVSSERISIQHEFGSSCVPSEPRQPLTCRTSASLPLIEPPTRSLWPPTYFVSESRERSAPCFNGFWNFGPSLVLSTKTGGRCPCDFSSSSAIAVQGQRDRRDHWSGWP